jgi:SagB-type dehydrogenase family enzyme
MPEVTVTARLYHELTTYRPGDDFPAKPAEHELVIQDFVANDFERWPAPCKAYQPELPTTELPRKWPRDPTPATAVLARGANPQPLNLATLARVLYLSAGIVRIGERPNKPPNLFRAAGSAGGRFPLELYLSARGVDGLDDGIHWYDPLGHALRRIAPPAKGDATTLIVTGVPWRTAWRYSERGFRHIYWDAGTMLAQTLALSGGRLYSRFPDATVTRLVGADGTHEFPVALVALADGAPAIEPSGEAARGEVDSAPFEFPLITLAQHAGDVDDLGEPWPEGEAIDAPESADLDSVLLQRGSSRRMDAAATIPRSTYEFAMRSAMRGIDVVHFVAVHGVEDVEPGLYRWPDRQLRTGNLREELLWVCWEQDLGRDAAFVAIGAADLGSLDDHGYREAQLASGVVEGRLHIAAYALGIGASGMTFLDTEIEPLLGEPLAALLFTCVGVPTYRNRPGGEPGAPVAVSTPIAGLTELPESPFK